MITARAVSIFLAFSVLVACSSTKWVHPSKNEDRLAADQMSCEREYQNMMVTNPGVASMHTNITIERQRMAACLQRKGWREIEQK